MKIPKHPSLIVAIILLSVTLVSAADWKTDDHGLFYTANPIGEGTEIKIKVASGEFDNVRIAEFFGPKENGIVGQELRVWGKQYDNKHGSLADFLGRVPTSERGSDRDHESEWPPLGGRYRDDILPPSREVLVGVTYLGRATRYAESLSHAPDVATRKAQSCLRVPYRDDVNLSRGTERGTCRRLSRSHHSPGSASDCLE